MSQHRKIRARSVVLTIPVIAVLIGILVVGGITAVSNFRASADEATWTHLSTTTGDLETPSVSTEQTASLVLDIDLDGTNDFVIGIRKNPGPSMVWYQKNATGWTKYLIDDTPLDIEAGGTYYDIDGDGDLDIVMGGDYRSNRVWWWENPYPNFDPNTPWTRREIKSSGDKKHHDQMFGDFDGDGQGELVFWNQNAQSLFLADIPADPHNTSPWSYTAIYTWGGGDEHEGLSQADIDGDGINDIIGGGRWFKYNGGTNYTANIIDDGQRFSRSAAAQLIPGGRPEVVFVIGDGAGPLKWYQWNGTDWSAFELNSNVDHGHSMDIVDMNQDGNLDIFVAEMRLNGGNSDAKMYLYEGNSGGTFTETIIATGYGNHESKVADLDGDGDLDVLGKTFNWETPRLDIWLNPVNDAGSGGALDQWERHEVDTERPWRAIFVNGKDINGDGLKDIVSGGWWYQNPGTPAGAWTRHTIGAPLNQMATVYDFDQDGDQDILGTKARGSQSNADFVWAQNDGFGNFTIHENIESANGDFLQGVTVAEFQTGSGLEVALSWHIQNRGVQRLTVPADPVNTTWAWTTISAESQDEDLSQGDIDNDGDLDLLLGTEWLENDLADLGNWWDAAWAYRVPVAVPADAVARFDKPAEVELNFTPLLNGAGTFDPNSLRVVEVDASGAVINSAVPFQFDPATGYDANSNAVGTVVFMMVGETAVSTPRTYHIYFDTTAQGIAPASVSAQVTVTDGIIDSAQESFQIDTNSGTYFYQKTAAGFSSLLDSNGNDWIGFQPSGGSAGDFRGIPNLVYPEGYFHPGDTNSTSTLLSSGPIKATIHSITNDGQWEAIWEIYPSYANMTVLSAPQNYWFLYEGTPGGSLDVDSDFMVRPDGTQTPLSQSWNGDIAGDEWVYFGDPTVGRSLFVVNHTDDSAHDSYFQLDNQMTVFGFGRQNLNKTLSQVPGTFTVGLIDVVEQATAVPLIQSAYKELTPTAGSAETRPADSGSGSWIHHIFHTDSADADRNELADMNGDGRLDAVVGYEAISVEGKVAWYEQGIDPAGAWTEHVIANIVGPMSLDVADLDGDGDMDVVVGEHNTNNPNSASLHILENVDGLGTVWQDYVISTGDEHHDGARLVDIDNDGDLDIMSIGWTHDRVLIYENKSDGGGVVNPPTPTTTAAPIDTPVPTATSPAPPTAVPGGRVTSGLQALYTFTEGAGAVINDVSGSGAPLNLTIADPANTSWIAGGGLSIDTSTIIVSNEPASKIVAASQASNELTVEAWVQPANITQYGPARIVTLSSTPLLRNFTLGQGQRGNLPKDVFDVRVRTTDTNLNGEPSITSPNGNASTNLVHVVYTRSSDGTVTLYVDGVPTVTDVRGGDLSNWDGNFLLGLGNELDNSRPWLGDMHLVAVYGRSLTNSEVTTNFSAGPRVSATPDPTATAVPPTETAVPPTATNVPPTPTTVPPTATSVPPTPTTIPPTETAVPPTPTTEPTTGRVTEGLQMLYTFDEGNGETVTDVSGVGAPLNLTIEDSDHVTWLPGGGLSLDEYTSITANAHTTKLLTASQATNELTIEVWVNPANITQDGPARIVSLSDGAYTRNFMMGQGLWRNRPSEVIDVRLRTTETDGNGRPSLTSPTGSITPDLMHIVFTRSADGTTAIYINNELVASDVLNGDFSNWGLFTFVLGNESDGSRGWLGEMYLVAVYSEALTAVEVDQNYNAGH